MSGRFWEDRNQTLQFYATQNGGNFLLPKDQQEKEFHITVDRRPLLLRRATGGKMNFGASTTATSTAIERRGGVDQIITARSSNKKFGHDAMHTPHMGMTASLISSDILSIFTDRDNFIVTL
ncbi:hypothetical protein RRF57_001949 [Xylaria bambusicola]|uniref:Uncharacterized protein n=1 Tax=Xylaria bambusicola TaxID=326684 RepID=A0AAN7UI07_9PEZI